MINSVNFVSNVIRVTSGSFFGQLVFISTTPIITRIYDPEVFGFFAIYSAIVRLVSGISPLRYEMAILIAEQKEDVKHLVLISSIFVFCVCLLSYVIISAIDFLMGFIVAIGVINSHKLLICLGIFFTGMINVIVSLETKNGQFRSIALFKFIKPLSTSIVNVLYGIILKSTSLGLIIGDLIGSFLGLLYLTFESIKDFKSKSLSDLSKNKTLYLLKRYKSFPLFGTISVLINSAMIHLPVIIISNFQTPLIVGLYSLANRVLQMPMALFNSGLSQVFLKNASDNKSNSLVAPLVTKTLIRLIMVSIFPIFLVLLIGEDIFSFIFGKKWVLAGKYLQILSLWAFSAFLVQPLSQLVNVYEKQKEALIINIIRLIIRLGILLFCLTYIDNFTATLFYFSIAGLLSNILFLIWLLKIVGCSLGPINVAIMKYTSISLFFCIPIYMIINFTNLATTYTILSSIFLMILYFVYTIFSDHGLKNLLFESIKSLNGSK